jgi:hypothetical protein
MELGQTYFSTFNDKGILKVRRHQWDNHPVDVIHKSSGNCFNSREIAIQHAESVNKDTKSLYCYCDKCLTHTRHLNGKCHDCK